MSAMLTCACDTFDSAQIQGGCAVKNKTWASEVFGMPRQESDPYYAAFERVFWRDWLENGLATHRVVETWRRDDFLAGLEVAAVGACVVDLEKIDPRWVKDLATMIRRSKGGEEHGFVFELMACGWLAAGGMDIRPAPIATPGLDAELHFDDGYRLRLSFKNFDISEQEKNFRNRAKALRAQFRRLIPPGSAMRMSVRGTEPMNEDDFDAVKANLRRLISGWSGFVVPARVGADIRPLLAEPGAAAFARSRASDQCIIVAPQYPNEQRRFEGKLREACRDMARRVPRSDHAGNVLMVRLHSTANSDRLHERAVQLVTSEVADVDAIVLYQPTIVRAANQSMLVHHVRVAYGPQFDGRGHTLSFRPLVGLFANEPSKIEMMAGEQPIATLTGDYVYQAGDFYRSLSLADGSQTANAQKIADGVHEHIMIEGPDGRESEVKGRFPEHDTLRLL
jgi:hypothetical protein